MTYAPTIREEKIATKKTVTEKPRVKTTRWEFDLGEAAGLELFGPNDAHLRYLANYFVSALAVRGDKLVVTGPQQERELIEAVFRDLLHIKNGKKDAVRDSDVRTAVALATERLRKRPRSDDSHHVKFEEATPENGNVDLVPVSPLLRKPVSPRTANQGLYLELIRENPIVFATGPAGSGKTYLAVAAAVSALLEGEIERIVLVRPAVEAGEHLGFLPGDLKEKVDPYFRPIYDALMEMLPAEKLKRFLYSGMIEIAPLAYMRGRTLNNAFVILDEAQNTTSGQMKMFLTRIGRQSRAVITGDLSQIDLPKGERSGLEEALQILNGVDGIAKLEMTSSDVVRHGLVVEIIAAYERLQKPKYHRAN
ncbi:MAG: PhoH family protein [bacterium]|nr:PhoH family protein [bacterium]